jgi:hypothetical protein
MTDKMLDTVVRIDQRFARSANVERDRSARDLEGYIPTARALDVLGRVVSGLEGVEASRAISVTGPYGSGKSSLGIFMGALFGPEGSARKTADRLLEAAEPELARRLAAVRSRVGSRGFVFAPVVAQREPITATLLRALKVGVGRYLDSARNPRRSAAFKAVEEADGTPTASELQALLEGLTSIAPIVLLVDEFGKNLEQFVATGGNEDDLFVLQELAEWSAGATTNPLVLLTMQHLAFEDYAAGASTAQRREWSKVQGRFADVPFVESPAQSQALIATIFTTTATLDRWTSGMQRAVETLGLADQLHVDLEDLFPLHPLTAAVLPELSFRAGPDPGAVPSFLSSTALGRTTDLASVRLDGVYDFFLEAASTMVAASSSASRWLEIETRIRDAIGLADAELRLLKSVAVLNLVTAGGVLRASRDLLHFAAVGSSPELKSDADVDRHLAALEARGLITYRAFADEFRVWRGTDFDLQGSVELARRRLADESPAAVLQRVRPPAPVVAARHSQETGILRVFEQRYVDADTTVTISPSQTYDGLVLLDVDPKKKLPEVAGHVDGYPVLVGSPQDSGPLLRAALELAALADVLTSPEGLAADWVARQELSERAAAAAAAVDHEVQQAFGSGDGMVKWRNLGESLPAGRAPKTISLMAKLSEVCDELYDQSPIIRNEMLSRRDLTSQGARARRDLLEAMVTADDEERCGIEGFGPERAMYEAILARPQIHRRLDEGRFGFAAPFDDPDSDDDLNFGPAWEVTQRYFDDAEDQRLPLEELYHRLMAPPIGLKEGPIPVLVVAALIERAADVALYENGSFVLKLTTPVVERLICNPDLFEVKAFALRGRRGAVVDALGEKLEVSAVSGPGSRVGSLVSVVGPLLGRVRSIPSYAQRTESMGDAPKAIRSLLFEAREPDELLFSDLPVALGFSPIKPSSRVDQATIDAFVVQLVGAVKTLLAAHSQLLGVLDASLRDAFGVADGTGTQTNIAGRFGQISDGVLNPDLRAALFALTNDGLAGEDWLENVGMVITSVPPGNWTDAELVRFNQRVAELASALRRIEALHHAQASQPQDGFEALRISLTLPDGSDYPRVMWIDESAADELDAMAERFLNEAEAQLGRTAADMLLATLAKKVLGDAMIQSEEKPAPPRVEGGSHG